MTNLSVPHSYGKFKEQSGKSSIVFLNDYLAETAYETGFENQFYFSKLFSRKYGVPPRVYRIQCTKKLLSNKKGS